MIDKFDDVKSGKEFYNQKKDIPLGYIPIERIIDKLDIFFHKNDYIGAGKLLIYWRNEAIALKDKNGELAMENELIGYYRKQNNKEDGLVSVARALVLVEELGQSNMASGATIFINCATAYEAFGMTEKAMPLYICAEQVYKKVLSSDDTRFGALYNNMALAFVELGKFEEAENAYFSALAVMEKVVQGEAECAITYVNLAHMYEKFGSPEKISECMQKAYTLLLSNNLKHDGYYAFVLEKCAPSFGYFGDVAVYEQLIKEAKEIYART